MSDIRVDFVCKKDGEIILNRFTKNMSKPPKAYIKISSLMKRGSNTDSIRFIIFWRTLRISVSGRASACICDRVCLSTCLSVCFKESKTEKGMGIIDSAITFMPLR